jgi:glycosyltransferase involved in cell wall biosynthesis
MMAECQPKNTKVSQLESKKTIGLWLNDGSKSGWVAGTNLFLGLMVALKSLEEEQPRILLFTTAQHALAEDRLATLADAVITEPPPKPPLHEFWKRRFFVKESRMVIESQRGSMLRRHGVDALFVDYMVPQIDIRRLGLPTMTWIHDFQHLHMPEMFDEQEIKIRNAMVSSTLAASNAVILTNTELLHDLEQLAPEYRYKAHVLPIIVPLPENVYAENPQAVQQKYHLPDRFFYLPNQFWKHKNHECVLKALASLRQRHEDLLVVCTGHTADYRHPEHFPALLRNIAMSGLRENIRIIGSVPYSDVLQLMRQSLAVIQPSLYEGFGLTVAEADTIGKAMIVSDLVAHREQKPVAAEFFNPHKHEDLAACMERALLTTKAGPDYELELRARNCWPSRKDRLAATFMDIIEQITTGKPASGSIFSGRID